MLRQEKLRLFKWIGLLLWFNRPGLDSGQVATELRRYGWNFRNLAFVFFLLERVMYSTSLEQGSKMWTPILMPANLSLSARYQIS